MLCSGASAAECPAPVSAAGRPHVVRQLESEPKTSSDPSELLPASSSPPSLGSTPSRIAIGVRFVVVLPLVFEGEDHGVVAVRRGRQGVARSALGVLVVLAFLDDAGGRGDDLGRGDSDGFGRLGRRVATTMRERC